MAAPVDTTSPTGRAATGRAPAAGAARGSTVIADRVVAKIASQVALDTDGVVRRPQRALPGGHRRPGASVVVNGDLARVSLELTVVYPSPVVEVTRAVRARVMAEVGRTTSLDVREVDIAVGALETPEHHDRRVQ